MSDKIRFVCQPVRLTWPSTTGQCSVPRQRDWAFVTPVCVRLTLPRLCSWWVVSLHHICAPLGVFGLKLRRGQELQLAHCPREAKAIAPFTGRNVVFFLEQGSSVSRSVFGFLFFVFLHRWRVPAETFGWSNQVQSWWNCAVKLEGNFQRELLKLHEQVQTHQVQTHQASNQRN